LMRGNSLSAEGPGTSARKSCMAPAPRRGRKATERTIIPIPPNQWVRLRQNKIPMGLSSMELKTVAPVVVMPETDSNTASTKEGTVPEK
jgi:hypothetical protein